MNSTTQLIKNFKQENRIREFEERKQEIMEKIDLKILEVEIKSKKIIKNKPKARKKLAEILYCEAKNLFNPLLSSVLNQIIQECDEGLETKASKNVGGGNLV